MKLRIDRSAYIGSYIYWYGWHSRDSTNYLRSIVTPASTVMDIGANQGEVTVFCAKRVKRVLAFEPVPHLRKQLTDNIALNHLSNVTVFPFALSDRAGTSEIYSHAAIDKAKTFNEGISSLYPDSSFTPVATVELRTLDSFSESVDVMKIDVEGAELAVLRGAEETIKRFRPTIVLEVCEANYRRAGYSVDDVLSFLKPLEYTVFRIGRDANLHPDLLADCDVACIPN